MLLICFFSFLNARSKKISHDCNSPHSDIQKYQKGSTFNYIISCQSKKGQYVDLKSYENINSISISEESNVFIKCENETSNRNKINLLINGKPNITFKNHCYFDTIEILGSPTFNLYPYSDFTVRNVVLRNSSYKYPFNSHYYINSNNIEVSNSNSITKYDNCSRLLVTISDDIYYFCDESDWGVFFKKSILFTNYSANPEKIEEVFDKILPSINFNYFEKIFFTDFYNIDSIIPTIETLKYLGNDIYMNMLWTKIFSGKNCAWEVDQFFPQFQYLKDYFDYLVDKKNWRKFCLYNTAYLYLNEDNDADVIIIPTVASWVIIVSIVLFIIALFFVLLLLAYKKFRKDNKKKSQVENENSENSLSSNHFSKED